MDLTDLEPSTVQEALEDARHGRFRPLARLLRIRADYKKTLTEPEVLNFLADFLEGKRPKRVKGYVGKGEIPWLNLPLLLAAKDLARRKKNLRNGGKRPYGVRDDLVDAVAKAWGISFEALNNFTRRSRRATRPAKD
jgi:hypothetical protein